MRSVVVVPVAMVFCAATPAAAQTVEIGRANMFKCPEAIASPETRVWALASWMRYTLDRNPAATDTAVMEAIRRRFLVAHHCTATLRNMAAADARRRQPR